MNDPKIPTVVIEFHDCSVPDLVMSKAEYDEMGGYRGTMKQCVIRPGEIKKVNYTLLKISEYPTGPWPG